MFKMHLSNIYHLHEIGGKSNQEDYIWPAGGTATLQDSVFIVCDGVGGSENGEVASRIIAETMGQALLTCTPENISAELVNDFMSRSKQQMVNYCKTNGLNADMATTFVALILFTNRAFVSWCGDSRIYHLRAGEILYQSSDHSLVNSLVKNGEITEEEATTHPKKNIILKAIKADTDPIEVDCKWIDDVRDGDYFMLCTDGLLENITNKDLRSLLSQNDEGNIDIVQSFQQFCLNKTKDNYSMYLLKTKGKFKDNKYMPKMLLLASILVLLIFSSIILIRAYYRNKNYNKGVVPTKPPGSHTVLKKNRKSVSYVDGIRACNNDVNNNRT
jgi:protein phosphatase